jgi:hypothetical protein
MSQGDAYIRQSCKCQLMALGAKTEAQRASWLHLADAWLRLAGWKAENAYYAPPEFKPEFDLVAPKS